MGDDMPRRTYKTEFMVAFGARLRSLRIDYDYSLARLSEKTDISKGQLSSIEHGFAGITLETLFRLADGLDVHPMILLGYPEEDELVRILDRARFLAPSRRRKLRRIVERWLREGDE